MNIQFVDLYQYAEKERPEGAVGKLTMWCPQTPEALSDCRRRPAVLILPGGCYSHTSQREQEPVALQFAARGYVAFVLEYSCAPRFRFPTALREAAMAMAYIRANADALEIDPHMVACTGFSAGGHLCGSLGTLYDSEELSDIAPAEVLRPDALGLCYPVAVSWGRTHDESFENLTGGDRRLREALSLERLVRPDMPPVFLWHTRDDPSVPCRNALVLAVALEEAGVDFAMHIYRHGRHGLSTADALVYPTYEMPEVSWDVFGWIDAEVRFFADKGLKIQDFQEKIL